MDNDNQKYGILELAIFLPNKPEQWPPQGTFWWLHFQNEKRSATPYPDGPDLFQATQANHYVHETKTDAIDEVAPVSTIKK